ncbi:fimbrial protein [Enterobacter soli]|uniref:fimbrial protein n=1 Tax=Enterobacter soli TaxID=885040 RepID=UPI0034CE00DB
MQFIRYAGLLLAVLFPLSGWGCAYTFIGSPYTVDYGNIVVQRDVAVGQAISNEIYGTLAHAFTCAAAADEGSSAGMKSGVLPYLFTSSSGRRVYATTLPGVGISFGYYKNTSAGPAKYSGTTWITAENMATVSWSSNAGDLDINDFQPIIQFWKTGNIVSGSLSGQLASFIAYTARSRGGALGGEIPILAGAGSITQVACTIRTPHLAYAFGEVNVGDFGDAAGTTPPSAQKTQSLILDCDSSANINMILTGLQHPEVGDPSVLALTGQGSAGVAGGVGVQLLYNGVPLTLNSNLLLKRSAGGQEMFPLTARYYQTRSSVTTGSANASATLTLTYQ